MKKKSLSDLFIELASPDKNGVSRVFSKTEFVNEYSELHFTNGCNWMRGLKGKYKYVTSGNKSPIWTIQLIGIDEDYSNRSIRKDILLEIKSQKCVHTGFAGTTQNGIECDHKNGRYDDINALDPSKQNVTDFQPLCRQANLQKRSDCKSCLLTGKRFDAKSLYYSKSVVKGTLDYEGDCDGCYWFNPMEFKKSL
jgi:hypothetical protein